MHASERFQLLINHVSKFEEIEPTKRRHIQSGLEYFKRQTLCDSDRKDSPEKILSAWHDFYRLIKGSKVFKEFEKNEGFWKAVESSVGIIHKTNFIIAPKSPERKVTAEDFFLELSYLIDREMKDGNEKKLLQFGLWYLSVEARLAKPFRNQKRIELAYRFLHPRLKAKGFLKKYEGNKEIEGLVKYFITGSIL